RLDDRRRGGGDPDPASPGTAGCGGHRSGRRGGDHGGRPLGIDVEAPLRREGLRRPDPRPWGLAGPGGRADVRRRGAGRRTIDGFRMALNLPRRVSVLGSTGSVGVSTLDLFEKAAVEVEVVALTAGRNV